MFAEPFTGKVIVWSLFVYTAVVLVADLSTSGTCTGLDDAVVACSSASKLSSALRGMLNGVMLLSALVVVYMATTNI